MQAIKNLVGMWRTFDNDLRCMDKDVFPWNNGVDLKQ